MANTIAVPDLCDAGPTLGEFQAQNVAAIAGMPGLVAPPLAERLPLPSGAAVRIDWASLMDRGIGLEARRGIGYGVVVRGSLHTLVFSFDATADRVAEVASIMDTFRVRPAPEDVPGSDPFSSPSRYPHQDPELEAMLPCVVGGRTLVRWSVRGVDYFRMSGPIGDADLAAIDEELVGMGLTLDDVSVAFAGRADIEGNPPWGAQAVRFRGIPAADLPLGMSTAYPEAGTFTPTTLAGRSVHRGTPEMVIQDEHLRGQPYVILVGDVHVTVTTEDEAWAAEAIDQVPLEPPS